MTDSKLRDAVRDLGARAVTLSLICDEWQRDVADDDALQVAIWDIHQVLGNWEVLTSEQEEAADAQR